MKKVPFYLCLFLFSTLTVFGQKRTDAEIRQIIETYESEISEALSASEYYTMLDGYEEIIKLYKKHKLNKLKLAAYYNKAGQVAYELKEYKKALKHQQKALVIQEKKLEPIDLVTSYRDIIKTCKALKLYMKAVEYQEQIITILKDSPDVEHADLAIAYANIGKTYEASRKYQLAIEYFQDAVTILDGNEQYKAELKYYQESIVFLEEKLAERTQIGFSPTTERYRVKNEQNVKVGAGAVSELSMALSILHLEKNYTEALARFEALNIKSETGENWECIGLCHYYMGDYFKAIKAYQKAVNLSPELRQAHYHNNIGVAYAKNGQFEKAKNAFESYEALLPGDYWHYRNWAMLYALQDKKEAAMEQLIIAVDSGFSDVEWLESDTSLNDIRNNEDFDYLYSKAAKNRSYR